VPNAALRFRPTPEILAAFDQDTDAAERRPSAGAAPADAPVRGAPAGSGTTRAGPRGGTVSPGREEIAERLKAMPPERRERALARLAERGVAAPEAAPEDASRRGTGDARTIDSLFGPLPPVETRGRVWLFAGGQLKPVAVRLGISDGSHTELLSAELQPGAEVVTAVTLADAPVAQTPAGRSPLMGPDRRRGR
jgi:HlyD family secretion protein